MSKEDDFYFLAEKYAKMTGMKTDLKTIDNLATWLATSKEESLDNFLQIISVIGEDFKDTEENTESYDDYLKDADIRITEKDSGTDDTTSISNSDNFKMEIKVKKKKIKVDVKQKKKNIKKRNIPQTVVLDNEVRVSEPLKKIHIQARLNRLEFARSEEKRLEDIRLHGYRDISKPVPNLMAKNGMDVRFLQRMQKMNELDKRMLNRVITEEDWRWIDFDYAMQMYTEYKKEEHNRRRKLARLGKKYGLFNDESYLIRANSEGILKAKLSSEAIDELEGKNLENFKFEKVQMAKNAEDTKAREQNRQPNYTMDMSLKAELNEIRNKLKKITEMKKSQLLKEANKVKTAQKSLKIASFNRGVLNIPSTTKNVKRTPRTRKNIFGKSVMQVRGLQNLFNPTYDIHYYTTVTTRTGTLVKIPNYDMIRRIKNVKIKIPKSLLSDAISDAYYGSIIAASFFQMLVSNTPLDEEYDWIYEETIVRKKRVKLFENYNPGEAYIEDISNRNTKITKEINTLKNQYVDTMKTEVVKRKKHHIPDQIRVRDSWILHFKGVDFYSNESAFNGCFDKKSDQQSIDTIAMYIYEKVKNSSIKSNSFTYDNTNPRWEMLEYGYYLKDSKPRRGTPYGLKHGVKNGYSVQAPYGFVRLTEAKWKMIEQSNVRKDFLANFIKRNRIDVSRIRIETIKKLQKIDPTIGTYELDFSNLSYVGD